jgi:chaperonin cofactor prefoldin
MPYKNRIKTLEESIRMLDNQLFQLEKNGSNDTKRLYELKEIIDKYSNEVRLIIRAQWDNDHNTVDFGDDR